MAKSFIDDELGEIIVKRVRNSSSIRIKSNLTGQLVAMAPPLIPMSLIKLTVKRSRSDLTKIKQQSKSPVYKDGQTIGKSHVLQVQITSTADKPDIKLQVNTIICQLPPYMGIDDVAVQQEIKQVVIKALRKESKAYLAKRLEVLAKRLGYHYDNVRFTHASSRWGSCSSNGTISLNIALMKLSLEEIDYVLIHELCHTVEMNHSTRFWKLVAEADPHHRLHRQLLKKQTPVL